jgi:RNA polymerase sigma-70 factor (ECF subfamily)
MPQLVLQDFHETAADATRVSERTPQEVCRSWYESYGHRLYSYLRFHLPTPDLAEDLTAEVFLRALKSYARYDPAAGSPRAWLFRIAQNALRDYQRQSTRRLVLPISALRDLECEAPSPEERVLWEEEVTGLMAGVARLSATDREVIGLCYGSELSMAEAGEILGLSATATRTRLWRALRRLRRILVP